MLLFEIDTKNPLRARLQKMVLAALFAAVAVLLSPFSFPLGPSKCLPFQHAVNGLAGVILGPFWACGAAFVSSLVRNTLGTGTLLAFPGSIFGALAVGFAAKLLPARLRFWAALAEPFATATLGAGVAAFIASPSGGWAGMYATLALAFLASSGPGAILGCVLLRFLHSPAPQKTV
ncbi:MAG: energy coupling factor transporter S component ThiW [Synergistaceae bacterium]|nr:energy coupling factor transporter S component ThiW [Synergistaceae bacterium]